jgi:DNA repair protein RAD50
MEYLDSCIADARKKNACKTCCRRFKDAEDVDRLVKNVEVMKQRRQSPEELKELEEALRELETSLQVYKGVGSEYEKWERLKKESPIKRAAVTKLEQERSELVVRLEAKDNTFSEFNSNKREVLDIQRTTQKINSYVADLTRKQAQIQELSARQKYSGSSRGVEAVQTDIKKNSEEQKSIRARIGEATKQQSRATSKISSLQLEISNTQGKLSTADYELKEKKSLDAQEEEYKKLCSEERENIQKYEQELQGLSTELSTAQAKYDDVSRVGAEKDREQRDRSSRLEKGVNKLRMAEQEIQSYHDRDGDGQLRRGRQDVENMTAEEARLENEQNSIAREVKKVEDQLRSHSEMRRSITDNQRYRRDRRQLKKVREEIEELESTNAEEEKINNERQANNWSMRRNEIAAKTAGLVGQLKSMDDQVVKGIAEWELEYKNAAREYTSAHIMVETTKAAIEDLARYGGALDKAIMKYHQMKMEEINSMVEDLWRKTYQGTDIDGIRIRSEHETVKANKSYNYRVVMTKEDVELDMRGRCSAGQKVLASIIIRMALADCFGQQCGIIALDEPTTNLDSENIRALATSLAEIIKVRRGQKNFQLVVITHDEEFLSYMGSSDYTDDYFRVYRDDSQLSVIEKQNIAEVI